MKVDTDPDFMNNAEEEVSVTVIRMPWPKISAWLTSESGKILAWTAEAHG